MCHKVNPREHRKAQLTLKLIIIVWMVSVQNNLPIFWNQKMICCKTWVANRLSYWETHGSCIWISFLSPLLQTFHLTWDQKQHDLEMPLNEVGMGWHINQLLPLSVLNSLPHAFFFDIHMCNFVLIFSAIFNKGQVPDINWITDCSDKFRCWLTLSFQNFCQILRLWCVFSLFIPYIVAVLTYMFYCHTLSTLPFLSCLPVSK